MLHSSVEGRRLYESLGFTPTNEMRLLLSIDAPSDTQSDKPQGA